MSNNNRQVPRHYPLEAGRAVSVTESSRQEVAAVVTGIFSNEVNLKIKKPAVDLPFQAKDSVRIKFWSEGTVYLWEGQVVHISDKQGTSVTISLDESGVTLKQRKSPRLSIRVPFSFTVIDSANEELTGERISHCQTQDISLNGLRFETRLALDKGDRLEIHFESPALKGVKAVGWIARSEQMQQQEDLVNSVGVQLVQWRKEDQDRLFHFLSAPR